MKNLLVVSLTIGFLGVSAAPALAFGRSRDCTPPCPTTLVWEERVVTCYKPEWREEKVKCVVNRVHYKAVDVPMQCTIMVAKWDNVKEHRTFYTPVPKTVEEEVVRCKMVPVQSTDPCTGCTVTCYRPETYTEKVKCTVMTCKVETREVTVKRCRWEPQVKQFTQRRYIPECRPETVSTVRRYCVMVPYQTTVKVPVRVPCCP
jgi:hypothetical protein